MKRRLYYLLPDRSHAEKLIEDLGDSTVPQQDIHAVSKSDQHLKGIDDVHSITENDRVYFVEWFLWRINSLIFFAALIAFIAILIWNPSLWLILPLLIMLAAFFSGLMFVQRLPNVHLDEFQPALAHDEILLMVDVPLADVEKIDYRIHRQHPEVFSGGVCWHV